MRSEIEPAIRTAALPVEITRSLFFFPPENPHEFSSNTLAVKQENKILLFDPGSLEGIHRITQQLQDIGSDVTQVAGVILTHVHRDHGNGAIISFLREKSPTCEVIIPEKGLAVAQSGNFYETASFLYEREFIPFTPDTLVSNNDTISFGDVRIHALSTPGHTPHCMSFIIDDEEKKILIGGDTVWGGFHPYIQSDKDVWKQSLTVLDDIPFTTLIPGHGNPSLRENAHNSFTRAVSHFAASSHPSFRGMTTLWSE